MIKQSLDIERALPTLKAWADPRLRFRAANEMARTFRDEVEGVLATDPGFAAQGGRIARSLRWRPLSDGAEVTAAGPAVYMEHGTRAHQIAARGGLLRFVADGGLLFAPRVNHPGNAPHPFFFADFGARRQRMAQAGLSAVGAKLGARP